VVPPNLSFYTPDALVNDINNLADF